MDSYLALTTRDRKVIFKKLQKYVSGAVEVTGHPATDRRML